MSNYFLDDDQQSEGAELKQLRERRELLEEAKKVIELQKELGLSDELESETPAPTTPAGSPAVPDQGNDELEELRKEAKRTGNWAPYMTRQRQLAGWPF